MAILLNDVFEVRFYATFGQQLGITRIRAKALTTSGKGITEAQVGSILSGLLGDNLLDTMSQSATFQGIGVQVIYPVRGAEFIDTSAVGNGTRTGDPLPPQVSMLTSLRTDLAGRHERGRSYLFFHSETDCGAGGKPSAALLSNSRTFYTQLLNQTTFTNATDSMSIKWCLFQKNGTVTGPLTSHVQRTAFATQRRRSFINRGDTFPFGG